MANINKRYGTVQINLTFTASQVKLSWAVSKRSQYVFIAAPHRGTPVAQSTAARWAANLVTLPATVLGDVKELVKLLATPNGVNPNSTLDTINGIRNLSDADPFIRAASNLSIAPAIRYHSIIATERSGVQLVESSDGLVPYRSAHLAGAASEKIIESGHSVQEGAPAILEISASCTFTCRSPAPPRHLELASAAPRIRHALRPRQVRQHVVP